MREPVRRALQQSLRHGEDPRKLARVLLNIVRSRRPHLRYAAGREAHWLPYLKLCAPQRVFDSLLRRGYGLPKHIG